MKSPQSPKHDLLNTNQQPLVIFNTLPHLHQLPPFFSSPSKPTRQPKKHTKKKKPLSATFKSIVVASNKAPPWLYQQIQTVTEVTIRTPAHMTANSSILNYSLLPCGPNSSSLFNASCSHLFVLPSSASRNLTQPLSI